MASNGDKLIYFLVGGFVGAAVALLFAPKSGEETRNYLESKYREGAEKLSQKAAEGREALRDGAGRIVEKARGSGEALRDKSRDVAEKLSHSLDKGRETLARQKEQLAKAVEAGRQAYQSEKEKLAGAAAGEPASGPGGGETHGD